MAKTNKTEAPAVEAAEMPEVETTEVIEEAAGPKIEYIGVGAEDVKFTVDPKATSIRVYANGIVLTDY